jgi:hypothetical protein
MLGNSERLVKLIQPSGPMSRSWTSCLSYYDTGRRSFLDEKCEDLTPRSVNACAVSWSDLAEAPNVTSSRRASASDRFYGWPKSLIFNLLRKCELSRPWS